MFIVLIVHNQKLQPICFTCFAFVLFLCCFCLFLVLFCESMVDRAFPGLTKEFKNSTGGSKLAVDNLDLTMYSGQITALLGHNGAGKVSINIILQYEHVFWRVGGGGVPGFLLYMAVLWGIDDAKKTKIRET